MIKHLHNPANSDILDEYVHHTKLASLYPELLTKESVAWMVRQRHVNGLDAICKQFRGRIYIHVPSFQQWFLEEDHDAEA